MAVVWKTERVPLPGFCHIPSLVKRRKSLTRRVSGTVRGGYFPNHDSIPNVETPHSTVWVLWTLWVSKFGSAALGFMKLGRGCLLVLGGSLECILFDLFLQGTRYEMQVHNLNPWLLQSSP